MSDQTFREWGVYVYYAADVPSPAMRRAARLNLLKLADVGSNKKVGITAMLDVTNEGTQFYVLPPRPADKDEWIVDPLKVLPNVNSASTDTVQEFFQWSVENCPAQKIAFVFYGHGYAIDDFDPRLEFDVPPPSAMPEDESAVENQMGRELELESGEDPTMAEISADNFARSRNLPLKLIFDSSHDGVLNNDQVADIIRGCRKSLPKGTELAILGFDCCNMAMAEVLCEMEGCAEIAVAAESGLPFQSWISERMLQKVLTSAPEDPKDLAELAVRDFIQSFGDKSSTYVALSACNLNLCEKLEAASKQLADALTEAAGDAASRTAIFKSRNDCVSFDPDGLIDFDSFCGFLSEDLAKTAVAAACIPVREVLRKYVIASAFAPNFPDRRISLSTGLSIWFPSWIQDPAVQIPQKEQSIEYFQNGYHRTRFARATGWDRFLRRLLEETQGTGNMEAAMANSLRGVPNHPLGRTADVRGRDATTRGRDATTRGRDATTRGRDGEERGPDAVLRGDLHPEGGREVLSTCCTTPEAGIVVRASVEAIGPAGDAELTVNVKWPAASLGSVPRTCGASQSTQATPSVKILQPGSPTRLLARKPPALPTDASAKHAQEKPAKHKRPS